METFDKQIANAVDKKMDEIADFIFTRSQENIEKAGTSDTGKLLQRASFKQEFLNKTIIYHMPYATDIEYGTEPHYIRPSVLKNWVRLKLGINPNEKVEYKGKMVSRLWLTIGAIAKKIREEGTDAQPFLRPAIEEAKAKYGGL